MARPLLIALLQVQTLNWDMPDLVQAHERPSPTRAARNYMHLQDPHRLFNTFRAFGL